MEIVLAYVLLGAVAGVLAGLLGIGGGIVIVPALYFLFRHQGFAEAVTMHLAVGTSLASVAATALTSSLAHQRRGAVLWPVVVRLAAGIVIGALLGAWVADGLPNRGLRVIFGLFELFVAAQLAFGLRANPARQLPGPGGMGVAGGLIGTLSALLGIGGGTLTVPFLMWCNIGIRQAVATSAACGLPIALAGAAGFVITGWGRAELPAWTTGYVYWPAASGIIVASVLAAPVGAWLAHTIPIAALRRIFALLLALVGLRMIF